MISSHGIMVGQNVAPCRIASLPSLTETASAV
jgi:hypothetical protein